MRFADATQFITFGGDLEGTFLLDEPLPALDESLDTPRAKRPRAPLNNVPINTPMVSPVRIKEKLQSHGTLAAPVVPEALKSLDMPNTKVTAVRRKRQATADPVFEPTIENQNDAKDPIPELESSIPVPAKVTAKKRRLLTASSKGTARTAPDIPDEQREGSNNLIKVTSKNPTPPETKAQHNPTPEDKVVAERPVPHVPPIIPPAIATPRRPQTPTLPKPSELAGLVAHNLPELPMQSTFPSEGFPVLTPKALPLTIDDVSPVKVQARVQPKARPPRQGNIFVKCEKPALGQSSATSSQSSSSQQDKPQEQFKFTWPSGQTSRDNPLPDSSKFDEYARKMETWGASSAPLGSKNRKAGGLLAGTRSMSTLSSRSRSARTVPLKGGPSNAERRAQERREFEAWRKAREDEREQMAEEERKREEEEMEVEYKESRKRTVPRAHEVPGWYDEVPKRRRME